MLKQLIIKGLEQLLYNLKTDNSNISEKESEDILNYINIITDKNVYISKYTACNLLGVSRATFDLYIRKGLIPKGLKRVGFKELSWNKKEILQSKINIKRGSK